MNASVGVVRGLRAPVTLLGIQFSAVLGAMGLFAIFLLVAGVSPLAVFGDMAVGAFGSRFSVENALSRGAPLMLTALCTALPARLGLVVIGNEGALLVGGLAAAGFAMLLGEGVSGWFGLPMLLLGSALAGALWIGIVAGLRHYRGVNETISSLLLFYIGLSLFLYLVEGPLRDPSSLNKPSTYPVAEPLRLGTIPGTDVHYGLVFGIALCLVCHVLMAHTSFGFSARIVGGNLRAARLLGLGVPRLILLTCALGGAAAGVAGACEVLAVHGAANASLYAGLGFSGILVAFVARHSPLAIIPVAILLGGVQASGGLLQRRHGLPDAAVEVFKGLLFVVILASETHLARARARLRRGSAASLVPSVAKSVDAPDSATGETELEPKLEEAS
ncbi:MAG: ABC transporter permease [Myxococcales bacterium]